MSIRYLPRGAGPTHIPLMIGPSPGRVAEWVANEIAETIRTTKQQNRPCVLILPTGSTPKAVYAHLATLHRSQGLSFRHVITFNLDEYHGLPIHDPRGYAAFMEQEFISKVDIDPANVHIPQGCIDMDQAEIVAQAYEAALRAHQPADLCLLGIGRNGHIAFNEPGSSPESQTRLVALDRTTRLDAIREFGNLSQVPTRGITMGIGSIRRAQRIILVGLGENKAAILARAIEGPIDSSCPASLLQDHPHVIFALDRDAASQLTCSQRPWMVGPLTWDHDLMVRAVVDLAQRSDRPVLSLTEGDYETHGLSDLIAHTGSVEALNREIHRHLVRCITGWPGGKPNALKRPGDIDRPGDDIQPKRILIISPHPDDDVISMGGTLGRLVQQGHQVFVAYAVSGHRGVMDDDARRHLDFIRLLTGQSPSFEMRLVKTQIRKSEAIASCGVYGVPPENLHFLELPFYDRSDKRPQEDDVAILGGLLDQLQPHQIYAAGDLSDPNGTHKAVLNLFKDVLASKQSSTWAPTCACWLYRGAWADWDVAEARMIVPLSPQDVERKRQAILCHQSQKDRVAFPGADAREFWQRAADRNRSAAQRLVQLGLTAYVAVENFAPL